MILAAGSIKVGRCMGMAGRYFPCSSLDSGGFALFLRRHRRAWADWGRCHLCSRNCTLQDEPKGSHEAANILLQFPVVYTLHHFIAKQETQRLKAVNEDSITPLVAFDSWCGIGSVGLRGCWEIHIPRRYDPFLIPEGANNLPYLQRPFSRFRRTGPATILGVSVDFGTADPSLHQEPRGASSSC